MTAAVTTEAADAAEAAAARAGVHVAPARDIEELRRVSDLLTQVWGRNPEGVPIPSEVLRSLVHADGLVSVATAPANGGLVGAAVLGRARPGASYSFIAAAIPGAGDRGVGAALKQHQRAWALKQGITRMTWTFDPLVSRNARFNLTKLGARVREYEAGFYGRMSDEVNGSDVADRMVVTWELDSAGAARAARGDQVEPVEPDPAEQGALGPDGLPAWAEADGSRWCRVPTDVVALRRQDPAQASQWRAVTGPWLAAAFRDGWVAVGASRNGWYRLEKPEHQEKGAER